MGCFWSSDDNSRDYCLRCRRKAVNNLIIIDHYCEICISEAKRRDANPTRTQQSSQVRAGFGEYRCTCGRTWSSRLSWQYAYQICKRCRNHVYPHTQRELRPTDMTQDRESVQEHQKDLCQMCQQFGSYCGNISRNKFQKKKHQY